MGVVAEERLRSWAEDVKKLPEEEREAYHKIGGYLALGFFDLMSRARGGKGLYEPLKYVDVERIVRNSQGEPYSSTLRKIENEIDKAKKKILEEMETERRLYSIYNQVNFLP